MKTKSLYGNCQWDWIIGEGKQGRVLGVGG
jgi:hypothetical protein